MPLEYVEYWEQFKKDLEDLQSQNKIEDERRSAEEESRKKTLQAALQRGPGEKGPTTPIKTSPTKRSESPQTPTKPLSPLVSLSISVPDSPSKGELEDREQKDEAEFRKQFEAALKLAATGHALAIEARKAQHKQNSVKNSPSSSSPSKSEASPTKAVADTYPKLQLETFTASMSAKQSLMKTIESQFLKPDFFDKYPTRMKKLAFIYRVHLRRLFEKKVFSENVRLDADLQNGKKELKRIADAWDAKIVPYLEQCKKNKSVLPSPIPVPSKQISRSRSSSDKGFLGLGSLASGFSGLLWGGAKTAAKEAVESIAEESGDFFEEDCIQFEKLDMDASYLYKHRIIAKQLQKKFTQERWPELLLKTLNWYCSEILKIDTSFVDFLNKNHEELVPKKRKGSTGSAMIEPELRISVHEFHEEEDPARDIGYDGFASRAHADWVSKGYIANSIIQTELNKVKDEINKKVLDKCLLVQELYSVSRSINLTEREDNSKLREFSRRERALYFKDTSQQSKLAVPTLSGIPGPGLTSLPGATSAGMPVLKLPSLPLPESSPNSPVPVDDSFKKIEEDRRSWAAKLSEAAKTQRLKGLEERLEVMEKAVNEIMSQAKFNANEDSIAAKIKIIETLQKLYLALFSHEQQCYAFQFNINDRENGDKYFEVLNFCIEVINEAVVVFEQDPRFITPLSQIQKRLGEYLKEMDDAVTDYWTIRVESGTPNQAKFEPKLFLFMNQRDQRIKKIKDEASRYSVDAENAPFLPTFKAVPLGIAARTIPGKRAEEAETIPDLEQEALHTETVEPALVAIAANTQMFGTKSDMEKSDKTTKFS